MANTDTDLAWAAGIIDGEGCLSMNRQRASTRKDLRTDTFRPLLKVTMGHRETIERLFEMFQVGSVQNHVARSKKVNASWTWLCQCAQVWPPLEQVFPYLLTKREEAELLLRFREEVPSGLVGGSEGNPVVADEVVDLKARFYWQLMMLKSRWRFYAARLKPEERTEIVRLGMEVLP